MQYIYIRVHDSAVKKSEIMKCAGKQMEQERENFPYWGKADMASHP